MPIGVSLQLFDGTTPQANLSGIQALWWDVVEPKDAGKPVGKSAVVATDASGYISLDLSNVSGLTAGDYGFLSLYKLGTGDMTDSLIFSGKVVTSAVASGVDMRQSATNTWVRNPAWLALPTVLPTEQKVVGLHAIYNGGNFIAFTCAGNYTVDWGDGVTENFASGVTAYHQYSYANAAFDGTETTSAAGLTYKQAIVTVTPQAASSLTSINLMVRHTLATNAYSTGWLDVVISSPALTTLVVGTVIGLEVRQGSLEQVSLISENLITDFAGVLKGCLALESVPVFNTSTGTNFIEMFSGCHSLVVAPLLDTSLATNFSNMFGYCYALTSVPLLNTSAGTDFSFMFRYCQSLTSVPLLNTSAGTDFSNMFGYCYALTSVPLLNTAAGTTFSNMFDRCYSLTSVPLLNTSAGTNFSTMFDSCYALTSVPLLNTSAGTDFSFMFRYCQSLTSVPLLNTAAGTDFAYMFAYCYVLTSVPLLNVAAGTTFNNIFNSCFSLRSGALANPKQTISFANGMLSATELNSIYTNLYGPVTSKTITVTNNYGTASDTPSIATAKGWTVTG